MFESLVSRIDQAIKTLKGKHKITEINVAATVKEIRRALVDADVNYKVAKEVTDRIKDEALGRKVLIDVNPGQLLVKIVEDELTQLMGGDKTDVRLEGKPAVILMSGLQGSGKTTFSGKLARFFKKQNRQVLLVACDVYRPAAINQLQVVGEQVGVEVYAEPENKNPVEIALHGIQKAKTLNCQIVIIDTAGRLAIDEEMMAEIAKIKVAVNPSETLFVVDAMTGQDAVNTAKAFNERLNFDGVVLTKLDGDTRGGAALSIKAVVEKPIKFIGTGEKLDAIDIFYPNRMARRILDMGDVVGIVEKAQQAFDEEESRRLALKLRQNKFDLADFLSQIQQIKKMGNIKDLLSMLPGMGKMMKNQEIDENALTPLEAMIQSMTPHERENPQILDANRKKRIAKGSGTTVADINKLLKQFGEMQKMIKKMNQMGGKNPKAMANMLRKN
ncbi:MAG: signal recognition particle protein [Microscillaceae bacterium]|nr:signal recognition particle protein [Microscillaceae bacterium]